MSFDEQPDGDTHGECALEIARLERELSAMTKQRNHYLNMNTMLQKECAELRLQLDNVTRQLDSLYKAAGEKL